MHVSMAAQLTENCAASFDSKGAHENESGQLNVCALRLGPLAFFVNPLALTVNGLVIAIAACLVAPVAALTTHPIAITASVAALAAHIAAALTALHSDAPGLGLFGFGQLNG